MINFYLNGGFGVSLNYVFECVVWVCFIWNESVWRRKSKNIIFIVIDVFNILYNNLI